MTAVEQQSKYEIAGSDYRCQPCGAEIPCEAAYYSAVVLRAEGFQRLNFCGGCWSGQAEAKRAEVYAFWRTRRPPQPTAKPKRMRFDTEELVVAGDLAYERGTYHVEAAPVGSDEMVPTMSARHIHIFRRQADGQWKGWRLFESSSEGTPPGPPAQ